MKITKEQHDHLTEMDAEYHSRCITHARNNILKMIELLEDYYGEHYSGCKLQDIPPQLIEIMRTGSNAEQLLAAPEASWLFLNASESGEDE